MPPPGYLFRQKSRMTMEHLGSFIPNTVFTRFGVYFQIQSETETIDFPVDFDMAAVRGVMRSGGEAMASMKAVTHTINLTHPLIATAYLVLRNKRSPLSGKIGSCLKQFQFRNARSGIKCFVRYLTYQTAEFLEWSTVR